MYNFVKFKIKNVNSHEYTLRKLQDMFRIAVPAKHMLGV
jgi:hypothetical protein